MAESQSIEIPGGITNFVEKVVQTLVNWRGLTGFVKAFPDPIYALAGIAIIFIFPLGTVIAVVAMICSTLKARILAQQRIDLALARQGIVRAGNGRIKMLAWTLLILLVLALCAIAVLGTLVASQRVKADYSEAVHFSDQFAESVGKAMPELSEDARRIILRATEHIDDRKLAQAMSQTVKWQYGPYQHWRYGPLYLKMVAYFAYVVGRRGDTQELIEYPESLDLEHSLFAVMKPYIFALSYFDHLQGSEVRRFCAVSTEEQIKKLAAWIFEKTKRSESSSYWVPPLRS